MILGQMVKPIPMAPPKRGRGNPNWGKPFQPCAALRTEFEIQVERLGLAPTDYVTSHSLKRWCERHRNHYYIPEWLLQEWEIEVESIFGVIYAVKNQP